MGAYSPRQFMPSDGQFVVVGAGPAGLTAAYELSKNGLVPTVLEKTDTVGGIARTEKYKGYYFDMGGHRFFTESKVVQRIWYDILGEDLLRRPRLSRIYHSNRYYHYPPKLANTLLNLGIVETAMSLISYARAKLKPCQPEENIEQYLVNHFGRRFFERFFKTYTEKIWGIPCSELSAEWARQRIKGLSFRTATLSAFRRGNGQGIKSLIDEFYYPRYGPGMMWQAMRDLVVRRGGTVRTDSDVVEIRRTGNLVESVVVASGGQREMIEGSRFLFSMPLPEFVRKLQPSAPGPILETAGRLRHRDFLTVCLVVDKRQVFPDNWIYVHDPEIRVGRIQNFRNWSPDMIAEPGKTSLGLEYFCYEDDSLWAMSDIGLIKLAKRELEQIGLVRSSDVEDGCVFRVPKAYPVYDSHYEGCRSLIREYVEGLTNVAMIGRNGLHRYDNQDHAMLTGIKAVRTFLDGQGRSLWDTNTDRLCPDEERFGATVSNRSRSKLGSQTVFSR